MAKPKNSSERLEEAMATLINTQASFQANNLALQERMDARFARIEAELAELPQIKAILVRHEAMLEALPETIRQKIGFKPKG